MLFTSEVRSSDSSFVQAIWRTQSEGTGSFISPAAIHWDMLLMRLTRFCRVAKLGRIYEAEGIWHDNSGRLQWNLSWKRCV